MYLLSSVAKVRLGKALQTDKSSSGNPNLYQFMKFFNTESESTQGLRWSKVKTFSIICALSVLLMLIKRSRKIGQILVLSETGHFWYQHKYFDFGTIHTISHYITQARRDLVQNTLE